MPDPADRTWQHAIPRLTGFMDMTSGQMLNRRAARKILRLAREEQPQ